jgi:hypothetical protein
VVDTFSSIAGWHYWLMREDAAHQLALIVNSNSEHGTLPVKVFLSSTAVMQRLLEAGLLDLSLLNGSTVTVLSLSFTSTAEEQEV